MRTIVGVMVLCALRSAPVQSPTPTRVPVRQIGRLERVTTDSLASANSVVHLRDGSVLVNDVRGRRLLLFDSTLSHPRIIADTTSATANAYSRQFASLIGYRGDSALFIDIGSLSMLVIGPNGAVARIMAIPRPNDAQRLLTNWGVPAVDARGRLVYHANAGPEGVIMQCCLGSQERPLVDSSGRPVVGKHVIPKPDSAFVVAVNLGTRITDTIATIRIAYTRQRFVLDNQGFLTAIEQTRMPLPIVDGWAVIRDGSIAVVRGRDYHVDWFDARGSTSSPKLSFAWERLDDARKLAIIDSTNKQEQALADDRARLRAGQPAGRAGAGAAGGRGGGAGRGDGVAGAERPIPGIIVPAALADMPDYVPPFGANATYADADNNVWIRTSTLVDGRPVYDLVNRAGELFDRVQLPSFRTIVGFGPGVVYMAVTDSAGTVRLERARIK